MLECPAHDWLDARRIPHVSEMNFADEAVCKLPALIKHMAVYNVRKAYDFTNLDYQAKLVPEYVHVRRLTDGKVQFDVDTAQESCADFLDSATNAFIWVNWIPAIKRLQADRLWIIEELECLTQDIESRQIHRPGVPQPSYFNMLPIPLTSFHIQQKKTTNYYNTSRENFGALQSRYKRFEDKFSDLLERLTKYMTTRKHQREELREKCGIRISSSTEPQEDMVVEGTITNEHGRKEKIPVTLHDADKIMYTIEPATDELIKIEGNSVLGDYNGKKYICNSVADVLTLEEQDCKLVLKGARDGIVIACQGNITTIPFSEGVLCNDKVPTTKKGKRKWNSWDPCPHLEPVEKC